MKFRNRKASVVAVLVLLMVTQIVFSAIQTVDRKPAGTQLADKTPSTSLEDQTEAPSQTMEQEPSEEIDSVQEIVQADIHVVYHSTVSSTEAVDVFEPETNRGTFGNKIVSYTLDKLYVRAEATSDSEAVGIMYSGSEANILEIGADWTKIQSGDVIGYVYNSDVLFGEEAEVIANAIGTCSAKVAADGTNIYADTSENATVLASLNIADEILVCDMYDGYYMVNSAVGFGYIPKDDVDISYGLRVAKSMELIRQEEAEAAKKAAEEAARKAAEAAEQAKKNSGKPQTNYRAAYNATEEEIHLLAAIVYYEAGWEPFEGQVAVANVVLNRVFSKEFRVNTIESVIYAPGQFTGVAENWKPTEKFKGYLALSNAKLNERGSYDAAIRALNGENNIDDYCFFISVGKANYARYTKYCIINNHCFYDY